LPCRWASPAFREHLVGRLEDKAIDTAELVVAAGEASDVVFGEAAGSSEFDMFAPKKCGASNVSDPKHRQFASAQRQFALPQEEDVVTQEDSGHLGMTCQHTDDVEVQGVSRVP
jgi:hypothetical protein